MSVSNTILILSTALLTWIVSTFYFGPSYDSSASPVIGDAPHSHSGGGGMQGGASFKKSQHLYVDLPDASYNGPSRVWPIYENDFPCVSSAGDADHFVETPASEGILFQRPVKTGSTTLTAIVLRLVHKHATSITEKYCKYRAMHGTSRAFQFAGRNKAKSYLLSVVRDPTKKAISRYFHFDVSVGQKVPTDVHFTEIMGRVYNQNSLAQDLVVTPTKELGFTETSKWNPVQIVESILKDYDFIALTERMDESLVVLKHLLKLEMKDILYISARSSGTFSNGQGALRPCVYLVPSFLTPGMDEFFNSKQWKDSNAIDILLYQAVYASLDKTIDSIGRKKFEVELKQFQVALQLADDHCQDRVRGQCSEGGRIIPAPNRTCVLWSEGCDFECLNDFTMPTNL